MRRKLIDAIEYQSLLEAKRDELGHEEVMGLEIALMILKDMRAVDAKTPIECHKCRFCDKRIVKGNFIGHCKIRKDSYGGPLQVGVTDYCSDGDRES